MENSSRKTRLCSKCSRIILVRFWELHSSNCKYPVPPTCPLLLPLPVSPVSQPEVAVTSPMTATSPPNQLLSVPEFSLDDRLTQLNKFEVLLLNKSQVLEFNDFYCKKKFDIGEPLFKSWLVLKLASIPTEAEALSRILTSHTATNIPKSKQKRKQNLPAGPAR